LSELTQLIKPEQLPEFALPEPMIVSEVVPIVNSETIPRDDKVILEYVTIKSLNIMTTFVGGRSTITKQKNAKTIVPGKLPRSMKRTKRLYPITSKLVAQYTRPSYAINKTRTRTRKRSGDSLNIPPKYIKTEPELYTPEPELYKASRPKRPLSEDYLEISPPSELYKRIRSQAIPPVESEKPMLPYLIEEDDIMKYQELSVNRTYSLLNHILTTDYSLDASKMPTLHDHSYCFHPLLPVFMLTEALYAKYNEFFEEYKNEIANIDDRSSYDINADLFEDYEYYYHFFNALYSNIANKINEQKYDVAELYNIGLGLRSFFFTNSHENITASNVSFSTFTSNLRNYISGYIELNKEEKDKDILFYEIGKLTINEIFDDKQFNEKINEINEIKTIVTDDSLKDNLLEDLYEMRMNIATQIINDRTPLSTPMSIKSMSIGGKKHKFTKKINKIKYKKFTKHAHKKSKKHRTRKRSIQKHRIYKKASRVSTSHTKK
jgi:hypothetical protein